MVQRSGKVSRGTAVSCFFFFFYEIVLYYRVYIDSWHTQRDIEIERTTHDGKEQSRRYSQAPYLPSNFIGKDGVSAKTQIRFFTSLTGVLTGRKNKRDIFYPARTSVLLKILSKLEVKKRSSQCSLVPSQLCSSLQSGFLVERPHQVLLVDHCCLSHSRALASCSCFQLCRFVTAIQVLCS